MNSATLWFTGLLVIQYGRQLWDRRLSVPFSSARYRNKCGLLAPGTYRVLLFGYKPLAELGVFAALCCKLFGHFDKLICRFENICPLESIFKSIVIVSKHYLEPHFCHSVKILPRVLRSEDEPRTEILGLILDWT